VFAPEREEEIIDPVRLSSEEFLDRILEIGHKKPSKLFSYRQAKEPSIGDECLVLEQSIGHQKGGTEGVRLAISESGTIVIDSNVTGRRERQNLRDMADIMVIRIEDLEGVLNTDFRFASALYENLDPYKRHQRFFWNAALTGIGYRTFSRNPQPQTSYAMNPSGGDQPVIAFREARVIDRADLAQPQAEIERVIVSCTRKRSSDF
jgi:hypothetical protein